jgi:hypothetical protein
MRDTVDAHRILLLESLTTRTVALSEPSRVTGGDALGRDHVALKLVSRVGHWSRSEK